MVSAEFRGRAGRGGRGEGGVVAGAAVAAGEGAGGGAAEELGGAVDWLGVGVCVFLLDCAHVAVSTDDGWWW